MGRVGGLITHAPTWSGHDIAPGRLAGDEQLLVENYFAAAGSLPTNYWIGISRSGSANPFKYVSGQLISDVVGNVNPYAHWWAACSAALLAADPRAAAQQAGTIEPPLNPCCLCPQDLDVQRRQGDL
jgi:hypothetical protein